MDELWETLYEFNIDYCEYLPEIIPELRHTPTPYEFLTDYVLTNLPFIIRSPVKERFPAVELWKDPKYMRDLMFEKEVTVAVTPDGRADSILDDRFMIPEERRMLFDEFYHKNQIPDKDQVYYLQHQNNNLIEEFSPLVKDVASHVPWVTEALGYPPDAANIWMGDERSVTSIHKDHYENIYYVITGRKNFILYPPVSTGWMPYKKCKKFQWYFEDKYPMKGKWHMKDLNEEVEWILPSHQPETRKHLKMYCSTKSYTVELLPGDVLYLPALWFHEVRQSNSCIAVNYWYDMKFDMKYSFLKLFNKLCHLRSSNRDASVDKQTELEPTLARDLREKLKESLKKEEEKDKKMYR